jgi:hypothetical protein
MFTPPTNTRVKNTTTPTPYTGWALCVIQCAKITSSKYQLKLNPFQGFHVLAADAGVFTCITKHNKGR